MIERIGRVEQERTQLRAILIEASELVEPDSCGVDKSKVSLDVLKCLPEGIRALKAQVEEIAFKNEKIDWLKKQYDKEYSVDYVDHETAALIEGIMDDEKAALADLQRGMKEQG